MESVKAVCVAAFGGLSRDASARVTIASEMIQFSPLLDHYKHSDFDDFAGTPAFREVLVNCHRASVDVLYLVRPRNLRVQDRRHQLFWERFFDCEDATLVRSATLISTLSGWPDHHGRRPPCMNWWTVLGRFMVFAVVTLASPAGLPMAFLPAAVPGGEYERLRRDGLGQGALDAAAGAGPGEADPSNHHGPRRLG